MTENDKEPTDTELDKLAENLYKRLRAKTEKESEKNHEKEENRSEPYALCSQCSRLLTYAEYLAAACKYCGGTKAVTIHYDTATKP